MEFLNCFFTFMTVFTFQGFPGPVKPRRLLSQCVLTVRTDCAWAVTMAFTGQSENVHIIVLAAVFFLNKPDLIGKTPLRVWNCGDILTQTSKTVHAEI